MAAAQGPSAAPAPRLPEAVLAADAKAQRGEHAAALAVYREQLKADPADVRLWMRVADSSVALGDRAAALDALDEVARLRPDAAGVRDVVDLRARAEALPAGPNPVAGEPKVPGPTATSARTPLAGRFPALTPAEAALARRSAEQMLEAARGKPAEQQAEAGREAFRFLAPALCDPEQSNVAVWRAAALIAVATSDDELAAHAFEAISRLRADYHADPALLDLMAALNARPIRERVRAIPGEREEAVRVFRAAKAGNAEAWGDVGSLVYRGRGVPRSHAQAAGLWVALAQTGTDGLRASVKKVLATARVIADAVADTSDKAAALGKIAQALAKSGETEAASTLASSMADSYDRELVLKEIAAAQLKAGQVAAAQNTAGLMTITDKLSTLVAIAEFQSNAGQSEAARLTFSAARDFADTQTPWKCEYLCEIAESQAKVGLSVDSLATIQAARDAADIEPRLGSRAFSLARVAKSLAKAGRIGDASATLSAAHAAATSASDADNKSTALCYIAGVQAELGQMDAALGNFQAARAIANTLDSRYVPAYGRKLSGRSGKAVALQEIATALAKSGQTAAAREVADTIAFADWKAVALISIAEAQAKLGHLNAARDVFQAARTAADAVTDAIHRAYLMLEIVIAQARTGQIEVAHDVAGAIAHAEARQAALKGVAEAQANAGQTEAARVTFRAARAAADAMPDPMDGRWRSSQIAGAQAEAGQLESTEHLSLEDQASVLCSFAKGLLERSSAQTKQK